MSTHTRSRPLRRPASTGFLVGFAMAFVATALALVWQPAEAAHPLLVPASPLLRPVAEGMADWNGLVNMGIAGTVNGAVYAAVFAVGALLLRPRAPGRA